MRFLAVCLLSVVIASAALALPQSTDDFNARRSVEAFTAQGAAKLWMDSVLVYLSGDTTLGTQLLALSMKSKDWTIKSPLLLDAMRLKPHILRSYIKGATPESGYAVNPDCYELNICDNRPEFGTASLVGRQEPSEKVVAGAGWQTFRVRVEGPQVTAELNGKPVLEYTDTTPNPLKSGRIGLQFREGAVTFRNIFVKPLGLQPLFDGKTLSGWREVPGSQSEFVVKNGEIQVTGGRGFLESEPTAANFVFQFEAITHGDVLNSGVFFRAIPGTEANPSDGYEFQIQNGFKDNDRNKPADFGTGALFRRVAARQVVANDREWLTGTLIADGPHFSTWVNGIPVVDWTDERPADPNPRKGLRLEAGHLSLQGHDPGTKLSFRNLRWANLPE